MKRQRNTTQTREQTRNIEVQINEEEIVKLPEKEFGIMIAKMIKNLENKMEMGTNGGSLWLWCCLPQPGALGP